MTTVEVRCPAGLRKLLMKLSLGEESGQMVRGNLMELSCNDCSRAASRAHRRPMRVLHHFNFLGELVTTATEPR